MQAYAAANRLETKKSPLKKSGLKSISKEEI
jgi:hypothetical protein